MAGLITTTYDSGEIPIISLTRTLKFNPKILHYGAVTDMAKGEGTFDDGSVHAVAVKSLRCVGGTQVNNSSLFDEHIKLLMAHLPRWTELRHKNINPVLDLEISSRPLLINPWIQYNLREIIYSKTEHGERWNLKQRLDKWSVIEDVCAGMEYLHTRTPRPVTHGALGMKAVLIEDNNGVLCAKLSNFGLEPILCRLSLDATLTRAHDPAEYTSAPETVTGTLPDYDEATGAGPPGMDDDPDIVAPGGLTPASDIYDVGTWMLELLSEKVPWGGLGRGTTYMRTIAGIRPTPAEHPGLPEDHQAWQLIRRCWAQEPRDRPSIRKVCEDVDEIRLFYAQIPSQKSRL